MKDSLGIVRRSDRLKYNDIDVIKDLQKLLGTTAIQVRKIKKPSLRAKPRKYNKPRSDSLEFDGVLGLVSFLREIEALKPKQVTKPTSTRAKLHVTIAKYIQQIKRGNHNPVKS